MTKFYIKSNIFNLVAIAIILFFATACSKSGTSPKPEPEPPGQSIDVKISSFVPQKALPNTVVTITGTQFNTTAAGNTVTFNGVVAKVNSATATQLVVTVPANATTGKIALGINGKIVISSSDFTITSGEMSEFATLGMVEINQLMVDFLNVVYGENGRNIYGFGRTGSFNLRVALPKSFLGMATDKSYNLYVGLGNITKINLRDQITILAGEDIKTGGIKDGTGSEARFGGGYGDVANDSDGNVYYLDASCIRKITPNGVVTTIAGNLKGENGYADGKGAAAKFGVMTRITVDQSTNDIYVVDSDNFRIRKITQDGDVTTIVGDGKYGLKDGEGKEAQIMAPQALAADGKGNIFFTDADFQAPLYKIRMINKVGQVSTFMSGTETNKLENGKLGTATTARPLGIVFDKDGFLYIVNSGVHVISRIIFN